MSPKWLKSSAISHPASEPDRSCDGARDSIRIAAPDGQRLRDARSRRHPLRSDGDHEGRSPGRYGGQECGWGKPKRAARDPGLGRLRGDARSSSRTCLAVPPSAPISAASPRPRPGRPRTTTTAGSAATRRNWRLRSGSDTRAARSRCTCTGSRSRAATLPADDLARVHGRRSLERPRARLPRRRRPRRGSRPGPGALRLSRVDEHDEHDNHDNQDNHEEIDHETHDDGRASTCDHVDAADDNDGDHDIQRRRRQRRRPR